VIVESVPCWSMRRMKDNLIVPLLRASWDMSRRITLSSVDVFHGWSIMPKQRIGRFGTMTKANSSGPINVSSFGMLVSGSWSKVWHAVPRDSCMAIHFICGQKGRHWRKRWNELQVQFEWDKVLMFVVLHQSQKNVRCDIQQIGSRPKPGLRFCHQVGGPRGPCID